MDISLYEKTLHMLANDVNCQKEIALGKRIGFYRLGKELGSGNFSKVKLGVHVLTKGMQNLKILMRENFRKSGCKNYGKIKNGSKSAKATYKRD